MERLITRKTFASIETDEDPERNQTDGYHRRRRCISPDAPIPPNLGLLIAFLYNTRGKEIYQKDIESTFHMARSTVSNMVKQLEKDGMVTRIPGKKDTRLKQVCLTEKGEKIQEQINTRMYDVEMELRQNISEEDLEIFFKVARQIVSNLDGGYGEARWEEFSEKLSDPFSDFAARKDVKA